MTEWEQKQLFDRIDKCAQLLEKSIELISVLVESNPGLRIGNEGSKEGPSEGGFKFLIDVPGEDESIKAKVAKADRDRYNAYREGGGTMKWNEWRKWDKENRAS